MKKDVMSTIGAKARTIIINSIAILYEIHNRIQDLHVMIIFIYLVIHNFIYNVSRTLFDLTIRKLNIISQSIEEEILFI